MVAEEAEAEVVAVLCCWGGLSSLQTEVGSLIDEHFNCAAAVLAMKA